MLNFISSIAIPLMILIIITYGLLEKNKVYDSFLYGAKEGMEIVIKIFPTLLGIFVAVGALRSSGIIDLVTDIIKPVISKVNIPSQIMPLAFLRPISGSASMAIAVDIMKEYGVDSIVGLIASTIMGSTETTFYTIAVYTSCVRIKKTRFILIAALMADIAGMLTSVAIWRFLS